MCDPKNRFLFDQLFYVCVLGECAHQTLPCFLEIRIRRLASRRPFFLLLMLLHPNSLVDFGRIQDYRTYSIYSCIKNYLVSTQSCGDCDRSVYVKFHSVRSLILLTVIQQCLLGSGSEVVGQQVPELALLPLLLLAPPL